MRAGAKAKKARNLLKTTCFLIIFCVVFIKTYKVLSWKDTADYYLSSMENFYDLRKDQVDVLFLGSSHCYCTVNNNQLWEKHGIASFSLAISGQDLASSYYCIKEALKTQHPKVIFVEGFGVTYHGYGVESNLYRNLLSYRISSNFYRAVNSIADEENSKDLLLRWPVVHTRYKELQEKDFTGDLPLYMGYRPEFRTSTVNWMEEGRWAYENCGVGTIEPEEEQWVHKIIELCKEEGSDLVFFVAPYTASVEEQMKFNALEEIAKKEKVGFLNFFMMGDDLQLNNAADFIDWGHTNANGATKVTGYLGKYLKSHYDLPDRRGDKAYSKWDEHAAICDHDTQNNKMQQREDVYYFLNACKIFEDYTIFLSTLGDYKCEDSDIEEWMENLGMKEEFDAGEGVWIIRNGKVVKSYTWKEKKQYGEVGKIDYMFVKSEDGPVLLVNQISGLKLTNGINLIFYDELNECVADIIGFDATQEYMGVR